MCMAQHTKRTYRGRQPGNPINHTWIYMQVKDEGYEIEHEGYCITIFSAPNYCDVRLCMLMSDNCCSAPLPAVP